MDLTLRELWMRLRVLAFLTRQTTRQTLTASRRALPQHRDTLYHWLDEALFPRLLAYTTHRAHIGLMLLLWLALLIGGGWTAFELVGGNYTNGLSGLMTCIIALQQAHHRRENREAHASTHARLDAHAERLDALHRRVNKVSPQMSTPVSASPAQAQPSRTLSPRAAAPDTRTRHHRNGASAPTAGARSRPVPAG